MPGKKLFLSLLIINTFLFTSCAQIDDSKNATNTIASEQTIKVKYKTIHAYGGWSCPDNLRGFPAVNIKELDKVPVVNDRLPTKEETQNGTSLMYFDTTEIPGARPLDMTMPRLARYYSKYTRKNELIIVIQAVVAENDTVVGFRYLNGGNGSAWFGEISFLSDEEIDQLEPTPFISIEKDIYAPPDKIWDVITSVAHARFLGEVFGDGTYNESVWTAESEVHVKSSSGKIVRTGLLSACWVDLYIQIDYNIDGYHYVEKFLMLPNKFTNSTQLLIVSGPYGKDFKTKTTEWQNWLQKVAAIIEVE